MLLVGTFLSAKGGKRSVCEDLAAELIRSNWTVICTSSKTWRVERLWNIVSTIWRRRHEYAVAHVDVFSGLAFIVAESACLALQAAGKPYVLTLHGGNLPSFSRRWPYRVRRLLHGAAAVTAPSRYLLQEMAEYSTEMHLLPNSLQLNQYTYRERREARPTLVWVRAYHEMYDPTLAPQVVAELKTEFSDIRLMMVGPDKGDGSLQRTKAVASRLGVSAHVDFLGALPHGEVRRCLTQGDIFLNTTTIDNTPVSVLEAMASGNCVVSTDVGGIPYLLEHERDSLLVKPSDAKAMAAAVRQLLTEPGLARRISRNARTKAEHFGWESTLPNWEFLLRAAATPKSNGSVFNGGTIR